MKRVSGLLASTKHERRSADGGVLLSIVVAAIAGSCGRPFEPPPCTPGVRVDTVWAYNATRTDSFPITHRSGACAPEQP